jgi:hypothetical protein
MQTKAAIGMESRRMRALAAVKLLHTAVWALMVGCIVGIPVAAWRHHFRLSAMASGMVWLECGVLAINTGRCPLSNLAERFPRDTRSNFDIYLPEWLARWNKLIFGAVFAAGEGLAVILWWRAR